MSGGVSSRSISSVVVIAALVAGLAVSAAPRGEAQAAGGIRIVRDQYGVPHVFADTEEDASFGVGYALAQDRLWQMVVFRHIAKGRLSEIFGPVTLDIDKTVRFFTYTQAERARRFATYPRDIRRNLRAFVEGINAWLDHVRTHPNTIPFEFNEYGEQDELLEDWTVDDSLALQDVLVLAFGSGGGDELRHARLLQDLVDKHGKKKARRMFNDLVFTTDPDTPLTIPRGYRFSKKPTRARVKAVAPRRRLEDDARLGLAGGAEAGGRAAPPAAKGLFEQLALVPDASVAMDELRTIERGLHELELMFSFGSNAQLAGPKLSRFGNSLQTGGPQVGYLLPQWLVDFGIHGGDFDATGMTFAGAGPAVLIGRGEGYAWTTTTGASDLMDTYVERLSRNDPERYRFRGRLERMDCREEVYTVKGAPFERDEICRTRHGPVLERDEGNRVAYSLRYAWFNREGQTVEGFFRFQEVDNLGDFATYSNYLSSNHNMFYSDDEGNFGYWHAGNHVLRARGIDLRLPQSGTGGSEWRGLRPIRRVPHAVNLRRGWLVNWNNQPSAGWERERAHPAIDNSPDLAAALNPRGPDLPDPHGGKVNARGKTGYGDMSANLRYAAFKHHEHRYFIRFVPRKLAKEVRRKAARVLRRWDGFLTKGKDGRYESSGNTILDAWIDRMFALTFSDDLGDSSWANHSLLWHVLTRRDRLDLRFDWLGKMTRRGMARKAFRQAVRQLKREFGNSKPRTWRREADLEHYQRINADLAGDLAEGEGGEDNSKDSGRPGDVRDHISMDRGTYNHVIAYLSEPRRRGGLGDSRVRAGSVIPPGQSGFIDPAGREDEHYEDQLRLYIRWRYKPMPMTLRAARAVKEEEYTITRP